MKAKEFVFEKKQNKNKPAQPNPVAKNAMAAVGGGGFGSHKDKKAAMKRGEEKHKKNYAMAEEIGYDEVSPKDASYILRKLEAGVSMSDIIDDFPELYRMMEIIAGERGLHLDDDFEDIEEILMNDLEDIAAQGGDFGDEDDMEEARKDYGYDSFGFSLRPGHDEGEPVYNPRYDKRGQFDRKSKYSQDYNYKTGKPLGGEPQKKGFVFYSVNDEATAAKLGLKKTKSGKWYLPVDDKFRQATADKVFGKGRVCYPKD